MIKHVILWKFDEKLSDAEKAKVKNEAKSALESLAGNIDGLNSIKVNITGLESSNADMMLDSSFADEASLKGYQKHPMHVKVADTYVRPFTVQRMCLDYEE